MVFETLQYILAIAEAGSISKAAQKLHIAQPNLSKLVSALEEELGFRIFLRTSKGITLTSRGSKMISMFGGVSEQYEKFEQEYLRTGVPSLKIASVAASFFSESINDIFLNMYENSGIVLEYAEQNSYDVINTVKNNESDLGFVIFSKYYEKYLQDLIRSEGLKYYVLAKSPLYLVTSLHNPYIIPTDISHSDLGKCIFLRTSYIEDVVGGFDIFIENSYVQEAVHNIVIKQSRAQLIDFLSTKENSFIISSKMGKRTLHNGELQEIAISEENELTYAYLHHSDIRLGKNAKDFAECMERMFR